MGRRAAKPRVKKSTGTKRPGREEVCPRCHLVSVKVSVVQVPGKMTVKCPRCGKSVLPQK